MKLALSNSVKQRGGEADWTPSSISSLIHWYKYDTGIIKDSEDDVTAWNDQKGSNNLTADGVAANSPLYSSGAIHFNSNADLLSFGSTLNLGTFSIYLRFEVSSFGTADFMLNPTGQDFLKTQSASEMRIKIDNGARHDIPLGLTMSTGTKYNVGIEREDTGSTTDDQMFLFLNNVSKSIGGSGGGTQDITELFTLTSLGKPTADVKFYEIIICNDSLSSSDRSNLETYLNTK
tara:strand:+ start:242 stop:940 length:699 start_codon:yes stop_codon:yes gene_type:complete